MRYTHHVIIPVSTSICVAIDSDDPEPTLDDLYEAAQEKTWRLAMSEDTDPTVSLGEETETHKYMNRGNVCHAACTEMEVVHTEDREEG